MSKFVHSLLKPYLDCLQLPVRPEKLNAASVTSIDLSGPDGLILIDRLEAVIELLGARRLDSGSE